MRVLDQADLNGDSAVDVDDMNIIINIYATQELRKSLPKPLLRRGLQ